MANGYGSGPGGMSTRNTTQVGVNRRTMNRRAPAGARQPRSAVRNENITRPGFPRQGQAPFFQPLSSVRAGGGSTRSRGNPNRRVNPAVVPAGSNGGEGTPSRFVIKQTGEPYNGRVMEHGGRMVTTMSGAYEGTSREVVGTNRPMNINPITNTPYSSIQDAAFRSNPRGQQNTALMDVQIGGGNQQVNMGIIQPRPGGNPFGPPPPPPTPSMGIIQPGGYPFTPPPPPPTPRAGNMSGMMVGEQTVGGTVMGGTATGPSGVRRLSDIPGSGY